MEANERDLPWYLFDIPVSVVLDYLERQRGEPFPDSPVVTHEAHRWHIALRKGLRAPLHLNVGFPGLESPADPVEENAEALHAALLLGHGTLPVILSGEWEVARAEGLITEPQLEAGRQCLVRMENQEEPEP